jgi:hypothetical protein
MKMPMMKQYCLRYILYDPYFKFIFAGEKWNTGGGLVYTVCHVNKYGHLMKTGDEKSPGTIPLNGYSRKIFHSSPPQDDEYEL